NMTIAHLENWANIYVYHLSKDKIASISSENLLTTTSFQTLGQPTTSVVDAGSRLSMSVSANGKPYIIYTKGNSSGVTTPVVQRYHLNADMSVPPVVVPEVDPDAEVVVTTPKLVESLDRGVVAVRADKNNVLVSWRLLADEPMDLDRKSTRLNSSH